MMARRRRLDVAPGIVVLTALTLLVPLGGAVAIRWAAAVAPTLVPALAAMIFVAIIAISLTWHNM